MRNCTIPLVDSQSILNQMAAFCQRTFPGFDASRCSHFFDMRFDMALAGDLCKEIFDAIVPELQQKAENACLAIVFSLYPPQHQLYFARFKCVGKDTFLESGWVLINLSQLRVIDWWTPLMVQ